MTVQQHQSNVSKPAWAVSLLSLLVCTFSAPAINAADYQPSLQTMTYEVYAGGVHALQAELTIDLTKSDRYDIALSAKTRGLLDRIVPWEGTFESNGWQDSDQSFKPELHKSVSIWRGEEEIKEYKYNRDGSFNKIVITKPPKEPEAKNPDSQLTSETVDTLTATLRVMSALAKGESCAGSSDVFDGKRRFAQVFHAKGEPVLPETSYSIYDGVAHQCAVEVIPDGGKWYKKPRGWMSIQEQGLKKGTFPTIWIAQLQENAPAIPVKILVKTDYGALVMHLTEYKNTEETLVAQKRAKEQAETKSDP